MDKERKTRIAPIKAGERVIAQPIREDLQDLYEQWRDANDVTEVANSEVEQWRVVNRSGTTPKDLSKALYKAHMNGQLLAIEFWTKVREIYDSYGMPLAMRSGYALVELPPGNHPMRVVQG